MMVMVMRSSNPGQSPIVLLGLDKRNVDGLLAGQQLVVPADEASGLHFPVCIAYGERLEDIVNDLAHKGVDVPVFVLDAARQHGGNPQREGEENE